MIDEIVFLNADWLWFISFGAALLLAVFIWKEWSQSGNRRFALKVILTVLAIASLAFIALKPALPTEKSAGKMVLLTEGYKEDQLDSLQQEYSKLRIQDYDPSSFTAEHLVASEEVFVLGHGLKEYNLWQLENVAVNYLGGNPVEGIVKLKYRQEYAVGDSLLLEGLYQNPVLGNRLVLQGSGGTALDSISLDAEGNQSFQLAAELKVQGNYLFFLVEKDSLGAVQREDPLPVKVSEKHNIRILILNSFPTFETKYLKNFLAEAGNEVVVRSQITRGRFKYEYINTEREPVGSLSAATLEDLDLLILDAGSLWNLSASEMNTVENEVRENGLGILIQSDAPFFNSSGKLNVLAFERVREAEVELSQWPGTNFSRHPYQIQEDFGVQPIHSTNNSVITGYKRLGQGRVGTTMLSETYQLLLDGHTTTYRQLWSQVVESIGKRSAPDVEWQQQSILVFKDEPFDFKIRTIQEDPVITSSNGNVIPLKQGMHFPSAWTGTTWPQGTGWNTLQQDTSEVYEFYVAENSRWSSLSSFQTSRENMRYFNGPVSEGEGYYPLEPVSPLWFLGLFVICMGGLWLEPKL